MTRRGAAVADDGHRRGSIRWLLLAVAIVLVVGGLAYWYGVRSRKEHPWEHYADAVAAYESGSHGLAAELFTDYLERYGEYAPARYMRGISKWRAGAVEEGVADVRRAVERDPDLDSATLFLAEQALRRGDLAETLRWAERALASPPQPPDGHLLAGLALARGPERDVFRAIRHLAAARAGGASPPEAEAELLDLLAVARRAAPDRVEPSLFTELTTRLETRLTERLAADPADVGAAMELARLQLALDRPDLAEAALAGAAPDRRPAAFHRLAAVAAWRTGRPVEAASAVSAFFAAAPEPADAVDLETALRAAGAADLAAETAARADELHGADPAYARWRARAHLAAADAKGARAALDRLPPEAAESPAMRLARAEILIAEGRSEAAETELRALAGAAGAPPDASLRLAALLLDQAGGRPGAAEEAGRLLRAGDPADPRRLYLAARLRFTEGDLDAARTAIARAIAADPLFTAAHRLASHLAVAAGRPAEAVEAASAAIRVAGPAPDLLVERARHRLHLPDDLAAAREDAAAALAADPSHEDALLAAAEIAARRGDADRPALRELLERAIERPEASPRLLLGLAEIAARAAMQDSAVRLAARVDDADGGPDARLAATALSLRLSGRAIDDPAAGAEEAFVAAAGPEDPDLGRIRFARALFEAGDLAGAEERIDAVLDRTPRRWEALLLKFELLLADRPEGADPAAAGAVEASLAGAGAPSAALAYAKGRIALAAGRPAEAIPPLERAVLWNPADPYAAYFLGAARRASGDPAGARRRFEEALRLRPDFLAARLALAEVFFTQGVERFSKSSGTAAIRDFATAVELNPELLEARLGFVEAVADRVLVEDTLLREEAKRQCERVLAELTPQAAVDPEAARRLGRALMLRAWIAWLERDWPGAIESLTRLRELAPGDVWARYRLGIACLFDGRVEEAIEVFADGRPAEEWEFATVALVAEAHLAGGRPEPAEALHRDWLARHPGDPDATLGIAGVLAATDRVGEAIRLLSEHVAGERSSDRCAEQLARLAAKRPEADEVAELLAKHRSRGGGAFVFCLAILEDDRNGPSAERWLAEALRRGLSDPRRATECHARRIRRLVDRGSPDAAEAAAEFESGLNALRDAAGVPDRLLADALDLAGAAFFAAGDRARAEGMFRRALVEWPRHPGASNNLAFLLVRPPGDRGAPPSELELAEAENLARRAVEAMPVNPEFRDTLGTVLIARGRPEEAAAVLGEALRLLVRRGPRPGPGADRLRAEITARLARARAEAGERKAAETGLSEAARIWPGIELQEDFAAALRLLEK